MTISVLVFVTLPKCLSQMCRFVC